MKELPEALAHFDTIPNGGFALGAANTAPGQHYQTASTFFLYGYLVGEEADTLLCGHPDLVY